MLVLASATLTIVIVAAVVVVVGALFVALGPLSSREQERDDVGAELGPMAASGMREGVPDEARPEDTGWSGPDAEEKLDQRYE
jgi:uncharacterized membrane protein YcjF (UPF0283 family)